MYYEFMIVHQIDKDGYYQDVMPDTCRIQGAYKNGNCWLVKVTTLEQLVDIIDNYADRIQWNNTTLPVIYIMA